jgi:hypothetical protein
MQHLCSMPRSARAGERSLPVGRRGRGAQRDRAEAKNRTDSRGWRRSRERSVLFRRDGIAIVKLARIALPRRRRGGGWQEGRPEFYALRCAIERGIDADIGSMVRLALPESPVRPPSDKRSRGTNHRLERARERERERGREGGRGRANARFMVDSPHPRNSLRDAAGSTPRQINHTVRGKLTAAQSASQPPLQTPRHRIAAPRDESTRTFAPSRRLHRRLDPASGTRMIQLSNPSIFARSSSHGRGNPRATLR